MIDDIEVGDNQPYSMEPAIDYSIPFHALRRNLPYLQVEFRQDEVQDAPAQLRWAKRFASALAESLPRLAMPAPPFLCKI